MAKAERTEAEALAAGLTAVVLWSTVATAFKLGLRVATPLQLVALASVVSWVIFSAAHRWSRSSTVSEHPPVQRPIQPRGVWRYAAVLGLLNPLLYYPLLLAGYDRLPAQIAQPLNYTWAVWLALLTGPLLGQRPSRALLGGVLCSFAGVLVLLTGDRPDRPIDPLGVVLILLSALLWALYWLLQTRWQSLQVGTSPAARLEIGFGAALVPMLLLMTLVDGWPAWSPALAGAVLWIAAIEMGFTFLLWQRALALTRQPARIGQLIFLSPVLAFAPIALVLGEPIAWQSVLGLGLILAGLFLSQQVVDGSAA